MTVVSRVWRKIGLLGALLIGLAALVPTQADALSIDPKCQKMRDKLGCTCALQNGGRIYSGGTRWASARQTNRGRPTNQAFTDCIVRNGGA
jgi:hypothetical protein